MTTLKLKSPVPFPASVTGTGGISVSKTSGDWLIQPDFAALAEIAGTNVSDPTSKQVWIYDPVTGDYNVLTLGGIGDALYAATSTTSLTIATGSAVFTTQSGKDFGVGSFVLATSNANPTNYMLGQVTSYTSTSLTVNVQTIGGSGTLADWTLRASAASGPGGNASFSGVTTHGVLISSSSTAAKSTAVMTDGQLLVGQTGADPLPKTISGDATLSAAGALTLVGTRAVNTQTGTTYTFALTDNGKLVTLSNAAAITATVPPNSSVAFPVGTQIDVVQIGAGKVTLAQGAGVTINSVSSNKSLSAQYAGGTLIKTATDTWLLTGSLIA
jgi:hypothetical protein